MTAILATLAVAGVIITFAVAGSVFLARWDERPHWTHVRFPGTYFSPCASRILARVREQARQRDQ